MTAQEIIQFWFQELRPEQWFSKDPSLDAQMTNRFSRVLEQAAAGELHAWRQEGAHGRLAEILVLDQFSRNVYRDRPASFAQDPTALVLSQEAIANGALDALNESERSFLLMPFMHSESQAIHALAEPLFLAHAPQSSYDYEILHKRIIDRFGGYPHRNAILGRDSTAEEVAFLNEPNSSF